ncbi:Hypothetical protein CINCED_3A003258 [Cinara cedri]|uniref:Reverse transcriptase/retrotransposon-derived protein RNase H-like domain-containing protein n=1 Tax=Cinara cedri TaxID=506608 RepID=A0A5E4NQC4_9HEMI|nr:Hypothetical protein CINCED_3A003258 [Cinara cedri]
MSPWNATLLLVKKKANASKREKFRIVIDFRALDEVARNEYHPLTNVTEILDQLGQCQLFSVIDLALEFYKILLAGSSQHILKYLDFKRPFILTINASNKVLGIILSQEEVAKELPLAYASRTLNKSENNYSTTE